ncbi:MAG TPA: NAD(P)H-dependent glycerol-3-phosphate dehydrogenase, partial [Gammaproteobacteria bacterium]|nr:NAD(P)H-dependent glycerol-3-phosphate dehydrogenase [Gammaproteobacteria bacterium]
FGVKVGGKAQTFMGLAGLGDLVLTCTDNQSRNRRLGLALARGETLEQACASIGQAVEGARTATELARLADRYAVDMPISGQVNCVLTGQSTPREAVQSLLNRDPRTEEE